MNKENLALHKGLMKILSEATFELKAREVASFAKVYEWANKLPDEFIEKKQTKKKVSKK